VAANRYRHCKRGDDRTTGLGMDTNLNEGRQDHEPGCALEYGKSITDGCLGWEDTVDILDMLADSVKKRRFQNQQDDDN